jgi:hypothetical protein
VVGVGGVGVSANEVLDLVHQTLLVGTGTLQVVVMNAGGGLFSAGKTGSVVVLVGRIGSVALGEIVAVSGQAGQLVVIRPLVADRVTVLGTGSGDPIGTSSSTGKDSVRVGSLVVACTHVTGRTGPLVKVPGGGVGAVGGRVGTASDTSAGVTSGQTSFNAGTLADGVVVGVVVATTRDGILDLVGHLSVVLGDVSAGTERSSAGLLCGRNNRNGLARRLDHIKGDMQDSRYRRGRLQSGHQSSNLHRDPNQWLGPDRRGGHQQCRIGCLRGDEYR